MKADTIKAALNTTAMKTPRNDMAPPRQSSRPDPGRPELGVRKDFAVWRVGRPGSFESFATLETQSLEKPNVTHLQRLAKSRVRVHIPQPIAAPEGSEINHGIHRNTRKRESEST